MLTAYAPRARCILLRAFRKCAVNALLQFIKHGFQKMRALKSNRLIAENNSNNCYAKNKIAINRTL